MAATEIRWSFQVRTQTAARRPSRTPIPRESTSVVPISSKRGRQPRQDQRQHRALVAEGVAEIERQDVLDVERQLNGHRLVEAEPLCAAPGRIRPARRRPRRRARSPRRRAPAAAAGNSAPPRPARRVSPAAGAETRSATAARCPSLTVLPVQPGLPVAVS